MIEPLKTNLPRCPYQTYSRTIECADSDVKLSTRADGAERAVVREERTEFAECVGEKCMAYIKGEKVHCAFIQALVRKPGDDIG